MRENHKRLKQAAALLLAVVIMLGLTACGRRNQNNGDGIPESTGGKDLARAELADSVFSLNSNPNYSKNPFVATNHSNQLLCCLSSVPGKHQHSFPVPSAAQNHVDASSDPHFSL